MRNDESDKGCAFFGEGVKFSGSLDAPNRVVIQGSGEGDVAALDLLVGGSGTVKGKVRVERADIHGGVFEQIIALDCLLLRTNGRIEGAASYGEIEIEKGGLISGETRSLGPTEGINIPSVTFSAAG